MLGAKLIDCRFEGPTLIITPVRTVSSLAEDGFQAEFNSILDRLAAPGVEAVVVDFSQTEYLSSMMLESLRRLGAKARAAQVRMSLCNVSEVGRETLRITHFDTLWPIYDSLAAATKSNKRT